MILLFARNISVAFICLCISFSVSTESTFALSWKKIRARAEKITVEVNAGTSGGSGIIVHRDGDLYQVVTAKHILKDFKEFFIKTTKGSYRVTRFRKIDGYDVAILEFESDEVHQVANIDTSGKIEDELRVSLAARPPFNDIDERPIWFTSDGEINTVFTKPNSDGYTLVVGGLTSILGTSGGPIFNNRGMVIGMVGAGAYDNRSFKYLTYGTPIAVIEEIRKNTQLINIDITADIPFSSTPSTATETLVGTIKDQYRDVFFQVGSLVDIHVDLFYPELDDTALTTAKKLQNGLAIYGFSGIKLRPYDLVLGKDLNVCIWNEIRYDPEEVYDVSKLHIIMSKILPTEYFYFNALNPKRVEGITSKYLSVFISSPKFIRENSSPQENCLGGYSRPYPGY